LYVPGGICTLPHMIGLDTVKIRVFAARKELPPRHNAPNRINDLSFMMPSPV